MKIRTNCFFGFLFLFIMAGCGGGDRRINANVSEINLPGITIHRYDVELFRADTRDLQHSLERLRPEYPFFLDTDLSDTSKLSEMRSYLENPRNLGFHVAVDSVFNSTRDLEAGLTQAFRHYLYYYPGSRIPRVYSYISGGYYDFPVQFADSVMLIGLDNFLGSSFKPYTSDGLPLYRIERMTPAHVLPECMKVLYRVTYPEQLPGNTLLEQMVEAGKRMLFLDAMIPGMADRLKIGFTEAQDKWVRSNEVLVWTAIIENRMLYSTDGKLIRTFLADGPFTAEFSGEAPPRLGEWIGWQMVKQYYEKQKNLTLQQVMVEKDAQKILTLSGYKPGK
jgi:hypothetical protein